MTPDPVSTETWTTFDDLFRDLMPRAHAKATDPGSPEAVALGCACRMEPPFLGWPPRWDRFGCPLHDPGLTR